MLPTYAMYYDSQNMCEKSWNTDDLANHHGTLLCMLVTVSGVIIHFNSVCQCPCGPVLHHRQYVVMHSFIDVGPQVCSW